MKFTFDFRKDAVYAAETKEIKRRLEETGLFEVKTAEGKRTDFHKAYVNRAYDVYAVGWLPDFPDSDSFTAPLGGTGFIEQL
ncbi:hypothetical protein [Streptomyces sp. NPDC093111]|uniref:hypothetical protein n=1 Tax=Streptomyces sp. NPDC093111 TaxID=3154978 RepID=UPI0034382818